jgi:pimeloyl-ACP methyl ester carboxylesterase
VKHYAGIVGAMPEKPVLVGHSMGGLIAHILLDRGLASSAVAIHSAPPAGVFTTRWSFLRSNWPMVNPLVSAQEPHLLTFDEFRYAWAHTLSVAEQRAAYARFVVPESRRIPRGALGAIGRRLEFNKPRGALLFVAGTDDHIIPASLNRSNFEEHRQSPGVTDWKEFPGRVHFTLGQPGWESIADFVLDWLSRQT